MGEVRRDPSKNCYCGGPEEIYPHQYGTGRYCRQQVKQQPAPSSSDAPNQTPTEDDAGKTEDDASPSLEDLSLSAEERAVHGRRDYVAKAMWEHDQDEGNNPFAFGWDEASSKSQDRYLARADAALAGLEAWQTSRPVAATDLWELIAVLSAADATWNDETGDEPLDLRHVEHLARAVAPRLEYEQATKQQYAEERDEALAEVDGLRAGLVKANEQVAFHERIRHGVELVLDEAIGPEVEDGAGEGLAGDVALLVQQRDQAREQVQLLGNALQRSAYTDKDVLQLRTERDELRAELDRVSGGWNARLQSRQKLRAELVERDAEIERLTLEIQAVRSERDLLRWLHAEAVWQRDEAWEELNEHNELALKYTAENAQLRAYADTTRYHQQRHAEAVRELEEVRNEVKETRRKWLAAAEERNGLRAEVDRHVFKLNDALGIVGAEEDIDPYEAVAALHVEYDKADEERVQLRAQVLELQSHGVARDIGEANDQMRAEIEHARRTLLIGIPRDAREEFTDAPLQRLAVEVSRLARQADQYLPRLPDTEATPDDRPASEDAALLAIATARAAVDTGERYTLDDVAAELGADTEAGLPRDKQQASEQLWNEAIDWLLNSRHTADPDIQSAFWGIVEGKFTRKQADAGVFEYDADGNASIPQDENAPTELRVWHKGDPEPPERTKVRDPSGTMWTHCVKDCWCFVDDELLHTHHTWSELLDDWGSLTEVSVDQAGGRP